MTEPQVTYVLGPSAAPEQEAFRDARAEAWRYALACLAENRREDWHEKQGGPETAPNDAERRSNDIGATEKFSR